MLKEDLELEKVVTLSTDGTYVQLSKGEENYALITEETINSATYKLINADRIDIEISPDTSIIKVYFSNGDTYDIEALIVAYGKELNEGKMEFNMVG